MENAGRKLFVALVLTLTALSVLSFGCFRNTSGPQDSGEVDPYPARSHPDSVLAKLTLAYEAMDLEPYLDCLADTFAFHLLPEDINDPEHPLPSWWSKGCEDTIHGRMFAPGGSWPVDHITLSMYNETSEYDPGESDDIHDDRWTYEQDIDLRVTSGDLVFWANSDQLYVFAVEPGREDTLWQIVDWHEVQPWGSRESSTWGSIKALWR